MFRLRLVPRSGRMMASSTASGSADMLSPLPQDAVMPNTLNQPESASVTALQVAPVEMPPTPGLTIVVAVVVVAALYYGRGVLIPITLAVLLSFVLSPLVEL